MPGSWCCYTGALRAGGDSYACLAPAELRGGATGARSLLACGWRGMLNAMPQVSDSRAGAWV